MVRTSLILGVYLILLGLVSVEANKKKTEDAIPVIEIKGEGKPMTAAQIRHLEEMSNGGKPLDIKTEKTFVPSKCPRAAERKDFVTFNYKVFVEDGRKIHQTYGGEPIQMQLGVGMAIPGLDKGIQGMCAQELRKIQVPFRLAQRGKSKVWKQVPTDEHWLTFSVDMIDVQPYSHQKMFEFLDMNKDGKITQDDLISWSAKMREFGKGWRNEDVDNVVAAKYYIKYFDMNTDGELSKEEWISIMERDERLMKDAKTEQTNKSTKGDSAGRQRDPGFGWILDFNNDGVVSYKENDEAADLFEKGPKLLPTRRDEL